MTLASSSIAWDQLITNFSNIGPCPSISIVIPSYNNAHRLPVTLESVFTQKYSNVEVIVVDASSKDRTHHVLNSFASSDLKVYSVVNYNYYAMLNRGISVATGKYVCFLRPGDFYLSVNTLLHIARMMTEQRYPQLVYCGSLRHDQGSEPKVMINELTPSFLKKGKLPTTLQSCWFLRQNLLDVDSFNTNYTLLADFELLCRLIKKDKFRVTFTPRVLVDDERRHGHYHFPFRWMQESFRIIIRYFGPFFAVWWLMRLKPNELFRYFIRSIKNSFFYKHGG